MEILMPKIQNMGINCNCALFAKPFLIVIAVDQCFLVLH
jgi:hypothetical protein